MAKFKIYFWALIGILVINACSETMLEKGLQDQQQEQKVNDFTFVGNEKAIELVKNFQLNSTSSITLRSSSIEEDFKVISIDSNTYLLEEDVKITSTGSSKNSNTIDDLSFKLYTIKFQKGGNIGFSIVSPDERLNFVYAYTENGALSDTTFNVGLAITIESIPEIAKQQLQSYYETRGVISTRSYSYINVGPIVNTTWNQSAPYNWYSPDLGCGTGILPPTGCTITALSQAMAFLNLPCFSKNGYYNFITMTATPTPIQLLDQSMVALFMRDIGMLVNANYSCASTGAWAYNIIPALTSCGYKYDDKRLTDIDYNFTASMIVNYSTPLITTAFRTLGDGAGHTWLICGVRGDFEPYTSNGKNLLRAQQLSLTSYYCNWGWGGNSNGWYVCGNVNAPTQNHPELPFDHSKYQFFIFHPNRVPVGY